MPRRGECIYKRKDGRWEARYVKEVGVDGQKRYGSVYAASYRAVKEKQQQMLLAVPQPVNGTEAICLSNLMDQWLRHIRNQVKPSTYQKYESLILNHIYPELGNIQIDRITSGMIVDFAERQQRSGRVNGGGLSRKTVNDILIILSLSFAFSEEQYDIRMPRVHFFREEKKEARVLSVEEQSVLTTFLLHDMDVFKFGVLLALYTGLRIGELCALQWEDITDSHICITKTMQRLKREHGKTEVTIGEPKTQSSKRLIPLPSFLFPYVESFRQPEGYVLRTVRNSHAEPRCIQFKFVRMTEQCGLAGVTFHTLRHTFATRCVEAGFDIKSLSEILGHADVKTTLNRYVHSSFALKQSNMEKLSLAVNL